MICNDLLNEVAELFIHDPKVNPIQISKVLNIKVGQNINYSKEISMSKKNYGIK